MDESSRRRVRRTLTRRSFLKAALATGGAAALPALPLAKEVVSRLGLASSSGPAPLDGGPFFLSRSYPSQVDGTAHDLWATAEAICARIVPTDAVAVTGQVLSPGAAYAGAVNYIDLLLAAFQGIAPLPPTMAQALGQVELPATLVTNPPIYLAGRYSGRYPEGDPTTGGPSGTAVADDFDPSASPPFQFLTLTTAQTMSWYLRLYGTLDGLPSVPPWADQTWQTQVQSPTPSIPGPVALRGHADPNNPAVYVEGLYEQGLVAFDEWSQQNFAGQHFWQASPPQQDALLLLASDPLLAAASANGLPGLPKPLVNPVPPPAAASLFGVIALHAIQGTYGLPEYAGRSDLSVNGTGVEPDAGSIWASIGWDGDTAPLGNSIYRYGDLDIGYTDAPHTTYTDLAGKTYEVGPTTYTDAAGYVQPQGGYVEYRPVSTPGDGDDVLATAAEIGQLFAELSKAGVLTVAQGGTL